ncbi:MAG: ECF transporter S component [Candidatus Caldatribacterium sp.]|nr:ECF transporter S component [Candidatus Caldatribacterium sp.]
MSIQIPVPQTRGYINLGDTLIVVFALLFGARIGALAGGVGSALADLLSGYAHWAPFTLIIKGIEGLIIGLLASGEKSYSLKVFVTLLAGLEMVAGYFLVEIFLYGLGGALAELPGNFIQAGSAVLVGPLVAFALQRLEKAIFRRV